jgi:putative hemolysin
MDSSSWPGILADTPTRAVTFTGGDWALVVVLVIALLLAAFASAAETALTSVSRIKLRNLAEEGDTRAKRVLRLLERPQVFLSTILVVSNVAVIVASTVATILAISLFSNYGEIIETIVLSLFVLIFCEITPKTAAVQAPERWARTLVGPVEWLSVALRPIVAALTAITVRIVRIFGGQPVRRGPFVTEEELRLLVEVGEEEGVVEEEEREMIHNVFELADTSVREVMVPRIDMVTVEADVSVEEAINLIVQGGQSRIPVYDGSIDNIIGVLYAKDLLRVMATAQHPASVRTLVRPAYFVPESKRLDDLLRELQQQRVHMAIVVDEYGAVAGLVTIEDLVEEIIGDIQDEYDREEQLVEKISDDEYIVDAKLNLSDFNEILGTDLKGEGYETLGGFVYARLDKVPTVGDAVNDDHLTLTVLSTKGRRVTKVKVVRQPRTSGEDDTGGQHGGRLSGTAERPSLPPPSDTAPDTADDTERVPPVQPQNFTALPPALAFGEAGAPLPHRQAPQLPGRIRNSLPRRHGRGSSPSRRRSY